MNIWAMQHDPRFWTDPYKFEPERFFSSEEGSKNVKEGRVRPFGIGPRACVGKELQTMNFSIFVEYRLSL
eukprot:TRINITY_DN7735_c0_g1_i1.p1 TRINITY_DN7735_c0_g1~~TRINITY_DN7735_c0_g1_i1.p1  ORF type:complete len:70 (+),score=14.64 TRINITY_DN7735_c0_g1_i1:151-360(+)